LCFWWGGAGETAPRRFADDDLQTLTLFALQAELLVRNEQWRLAPELHDGTQ